MIFRSAARLSAALLSAFALSGCAMLSGGQEYRPCGEVLGDAEQLEALADAAIAQENFELAYRYVSLIHLLHPESPQNRELFPMAAALYRKSWAPHRTELDSVWTTSEPIFMFGWLAGIFQNANEFPQQEMEALFLHMNAGFFRDFLAYAKDRPHVARWAISAEKDDGIVLSVTGKLATPSA